ncbi:uncharacterized protein TNCV_4743961 [Trichonephila clavipes]|nr:uncharacterized protein TNCV_4743961 [Trichonephila clavipes]
MQNDDESVTSVQEESDPVVDETDEDEVNNVNESSKGPSNADAISSLETAMEWYEQQSEFCPTQPLLLKRIRDLAAKTRRCTMLICSWLTHVRSGKTVNEITLRQSNISSRKATDSPKKTARFQNHLQNKKEEKKIENPEFSSHQAKCPTPSPGAASGQ